MDKDIAMRLNQTPSVRTPLARMLPSVIVGVWRMRAVRLMTEDSRPGDRKNPGAQHNPSHNRLATDIDRLVDLD
jgi:hypothetical protein